MQIRLNRGPTNPNSFEAETQDTEAKFERLLNKFPVVVVIASPLRKTSILLHFQVVAWLSKKKQSCYSYEPPLIQWWRQDAITLTKSIVFQNSIFDKSWNWNFFNFLSFQSEVKEKFRTKIFKRTIPDKPRSFCAEWQNSTHSF